MDSTEVKRSLDVEDTKSAQSPIHVLTTLILTVLLTGCAVGPDFIRPKAPEVSNYTTTPLPRETAFVAMTMGKQQRFITGTSVNAQWWRELGSPSLDLLVDGALKASPTLAAAQATLQQAQEIYAAQAGSTLYPQVVVGLDAQRQRTNPSALGQLGEASESSLYNASIGAHYQIDLAGGNRRALEALVARVEHRRYQLDAARLRLASSIVTTTILQARLAGQIEFTEAILRSKNEQLHTSKERLRLGQAAPDEVLALQTQVEQTRAELPLLRKQFEQSRHLLAVLVGRSPGAGGMYTFTLKDFTLPSDLPLVVPSELVRRHPDIQAAEALLHAANAEYGVSVAKLYPQLNISANLGSQALSTGALFGSGTAVWSLVGQLTQPLFNPGLPAEKRAALAAFNAAAENYQSVVLEALRNVADVLRAIEHDAQSLAARAAADTAAQGSLGSVRRQYALGAASYVKVLIAQQKAQSTRIDLIAAQATRLDDTVALYTSMGGGLVISETLVGAIVSPSMDSN